MANPFEVSVVNPLQALLIGQQSYAAGQEANKKAATDQARQEATQLAGSGDYKSAIGRLLGAGDYQGVSALTGIDNNQWTRQHTEKTDARQAGRDAISDQHWNADYGLRKDAAARAGEDKFTVQKVENPDGTTSFVRVKTTGPEGVIPSGVTPSAPNNPFSAGGKFNGDQGKAAGFTDRMLQSEGILSGVGPNPGSEGPPMPGVQDVGTSVAQTSMSKIPGVGNFMVSGDRQKYNQAKSDFINAQLRRESGAAIAASEFANADKQYFPVPGDKPEVIKQKAANRRAAVEAMGREGGGSYKPKYTFDDASGGVVPYGQPAAAQPASPTFPPPPKIGESRGGYRFKGGNPGDPANWAQVTQ